MMEFLGKELPTVDWAGYCANSYAATRMGREGDDLTKSMIF